MTKYSLTAKIGQGAYGVVLKGRNEKTNETVAIKQIQLRKDRKSQLEVLREMSLLKNADHENIIRLLDVVYAPESVSLVMEYVESNLKLVITDKRRPLDDGIARFYFTQLFHGVGHLHRIGVMHRDVKPENVLVSLSGTVKLADFGLACLYTPEDKERTYCHQVATRWYRAPELLFGAVRYDPKVDIWSVGCILAEFFNGAPLFQGASDIEQLVRVFAVLGTPTDDTWPGWRSLPDANKLDFDPIAPAEDWREIGIALRLRGMPSSHPRDAPVRPGSEAERSGLPGVEVLLDGRPDEHRIPPAGG
ncbi:CMGC/CDK protein kinase [Aphelenchoides avenae]|nr:CMGC/CDK protein kinase [Aphelenchus avenae]